MIADVDKSELDKEPVPEPGEDEPVSETISEEELAAREAELAMEKYRALFDQNSDFVGWISIDGTNINYPVMWTPNNPNYYLKHSFEKEYSDYGVPYIDEDCVMGESNNYVIYGHHMKNETMFHDLCNYASKDFYDEHPIIKFDTLFGFGEYQIVAVFRFDTNNDTFRYLALMTYRRCTRKLQQSGLPKTYRCSRRRLLPIQIRRCGGDVIKVMSGML